VDEEQCHPNNKAPIERILKNPIFKDLREYSVTLILGEKEVSDKFNEVLWIEAKVASEAGHMSMLEKPGIVSEAIALKDNQNQEYHSEMENLN
jgi:hypothetical protein